MAEKEHSNELIITDANKAVQMIQSVQPLSEEEAGEHQRWLKLFSDFLNAHNLPGLISATVERAQEFIALIHDVITEKLNTCLNVLNNFFHARGDLKDKEQFTFEPEKTSPDKAKVRLDFAKSETQAIKALKLIQQKGLIDSISTGNTYRDCLKVFCDFIKENKLGDLKNVPMDVVNRFLKERSQEVGQKSCDKYKQAIQAFLQARGDLPRTSHLPPVKSEKAQKLEHRAYTARQVELVKAAQDPTFRLSTDLAYKCGLRAHELLTIRRIEEKSPDKRFYANGTEKKLPTKFAGRAEQGVKYVVTGKGGLTREICIPDVLAKKLEERRLAVPKLVIDRGIRYESLYNLPGGKRFTDSFTRASKRALGWTTGAHGLRHSYAQERMKEVASLCPYEKVKETVSQELGHFRPDITDTYLR